MKLTRTAEYALSALLQLGENSSGAPVSSHLLARRAAFPERYFLQVLRSLVTHGLLKSTRGVDGGYTLSQPLKEISLLQLLEITDGPLAPVPSRSVALPEKVMDRLNHMMADVANHAVNRLGAVTLADLVADQTPASVIPRRSDGASAQGPEFHLPGCGCSGSLGEQEAIES